MASTPPPAPVLSDAGTPSTPAGTKEKEGDRSTERDRGDRDRDRDRGGDRYRGDRDRDRDRDRDLLDDRSFGHGYRNRGGGGGGGYYRGGGRGGGYRPRRYWDRDDDFNRGRRDRDYARRRRSRTRSRSRSRSRSYRSDTRSRSRSRSRSRGRGSSPPPPRKRDDYQSKGGISAEKGRQSPVSIPLQQLPLPPSVTGPTSAIKDGWTPVGPPQNNYPHSQMPQVNTSVPPPSSMMNSQNGLQGTGNMGNYYGVPGGQPGMSHYSQVPTTYPRVQQPPPPMLGQMQHQGDMRGQGYAASMSMAKGPYGESSNYLQNQRPGSMSQPPQESTKQGINPGVSPGKHSESSGHGSSNKKKKVSKKKKKRKVSSSSSSSSSSSEDSSESGSARAKAGKKKKESDESSDSSSDEDSKAKEKLKKGGITEVQREQLLKQEIGYQKKLEILEREVNRLVAKEHELTNERSGLKLIEENLRLQADLKGRCNAVRIVLDKIRDLIRGGTGRPSAPPPPKISQQQAPPAPQIAAAILRQQTTVVATPPPPPAITQQVTLVANALPKIEVPKTEKAFNFEFYDNGQHWCRLCNAFPDTLGGMLEHFHSDEHHIQVEQLGIDEKPWHKRTLPDAKVEPGAKKVPFRGMQFFSSVKGWYCRLCSVFMGDQHCATEHLKSEEHHSNFMNFLDEHPDWETKWISDREKARIRAGVQSDRNGPKKEGGLTGILKGGTMSAATPKPVEPETDNTGSIRVQMRNLANESNPTAASFVANVDQATPKDSSIDEWMSRKGPGVSLDILDTQKFAAILREKHVKAKDVPPELIIKQPAPVSSGSAPSPQGKDSGSSNTPKKDERDLDRDRRGSNDFGSGRRHETRDRVEMSFTPRNEREREKDRHTRDRDRGGGKRRSRSRTRSRERDRGRRYRSRSRSRDRESSSRKRERDRDGKDKQESKEKEKEQVRKLPMIGKMPLYKKPVIASASKETPKDASVTSIGEYGSVTIPITPKESPKPTFKGIEPSHNFSPIPIQPSTENSSNGMGSSGFTMAYSSGTPSFAGVNFSNSVYEASSDSMGMYGTPAGVSKDSGADKGKEISSGGGDKEGSGSAGGPVHLPEDLQHALDIIYATGGGTSGKGTPGSNPVQTPQPGQTETPAGVPAPTSTPSSSSAYEYGPTQSYNSSYMDHYQSYQQQQQSFEGYGPMSGYAGMDDGPPGVTEERVPRVSTASFPGPDQPPQKAEQEVSSTSEALAETDDLMNMDDLRLLGIDVDDTAVSHLK